MLVFASSNLDRNVIPNKYNTASPDSSLMVGEVVPSIGPYIQFHVSHMDNESNMTVSNAPSAFDVLMSSQISCGHVPEKYSLSLNIDKKLQLKSVMID